MVQVLSILPVRFGVADEVRRICSLFQNELRMYDARLASTTGPFNCALHAFRKDITFTLEVGNSLATFGIHEVCLDKVGLSISCSLLSTKHVKRRPDLRRVSIHFTPAVHA